MAQPALTRRKPNREVKFSRFWAPDFHLNSQQTPLLLFRRRDVEAPPQTPAGNLRFPALPRFLWIATQSVKVGRCRELHFPARVWGRAPIVLPVFSEYRTPLLRMSSPGEHKVVANANQRIDHARQLHIFPGNGGHDRHHLVVRASRGFRPAHRPRRPGHSPARPARLPAKARSSHPVFPAGCTCRR